ncbi:hypothetical protein ACSTJJ_23240, partial [Vibrio parahaemolyticus]
MVDWQKKKEAETQALIEVERKKIQEETQQSIRKSLAADYENQLKILQAEKEEKEEKLKEARKKELEFLQKEQALKTKEEELELTLN